jgi:hypothetical protein
MMAAAGAITTAALTWAVHEWNAHSLRQQTEERLQPENLDISFGLHRGRHSNAIGSHDSDVFLFSLYTKVRDRISQGDGIDSETISRLSPWKLDSILKTVSTLLEADIPQLRRRATSIFSHPAQVSKMQSSSTVSNHSRAFRGGSDRDGADSTDRIPSAFETIPVDFGRLNRLLSDSLGSGNETQGQGNSMRPVSATKQAFTPDGRDTANGAADVNYGNDGHGSPNRHSSGTEFQKLRASSSLIAATTALSSTVVSSGHKKGTDSGDQGASSSFVTSEQDVDYDKASSQDKQKSESLVLASLSGSNSASPRKNLSVSRDADGNRKASKK